MSPISNQTDDKFLEERRIWIDAQIAAQTISYIIRPIMYDGR